MQINNFDFQGLSASKVKESRAEHGWNRFELKKENGFVTIVKSVLTEPMVLLLLVAALIYFVSGDFGDGLFLTLAVVLISVISLYQESRSQIALEKLKKFTQPKSKVIRNGEIEDIPSDELVLGDEMMVEEGSTINADAVIIHSNDFSVNESILTGESFPKQKRATDADNLIYQGTTVATGLAVAKVTAIGGHSKFNQIGKRLVEIGTEKTPLEKQINVFVQKMVLLGVVFFVLVWVFNYALSRNIVDSLLQALTLAMSILPEEIPVAFTTFMAIGAWRIMKLGIVVKEMKAVETLGSATVICVDKTGTITQNMMQLAQVYVFKSDRIIELDHRVDSDTRDLLALSMWSSEPIPFDPMEVAIHEAYLKYGEKDERPFFKMRHEYPLSGKPPLMTHIFEDQEGVRVIAAKGALEGLLNIVDLSIDEKEQISDAAFILASKGFRLLGVAEAEHVGERFPLSQFDFDFQFKGLIAFYDPPKENIKSVFKAFEKAGIQVKIITGDNKETTQSIAEQIAFEGFENSIDGQELMQMDENQLQEVVKETKIYTRMFPEAKLRIVNALKMNGEVVGMTGDGVNDAPALKAAHIGIAMGKRGTEIAKEASSLILIDDDLSKMVDAVAMGRRIYSNLKKAIQYIISIHIPIILIVFLPLVLGWVYPNIFSPIHVILLELIMGPTCSIIYENEPIEKDTMIRKPRSASIAFFNAKELLTSIIQGLMITIGTLLMYQYAGYLGGSENFTRTLVFVTLISSNIVLTLVNRSFYYSILTTTRFKNNLIPFIIGITILFTGLLIYVKPLMVFFKFESISSLDLFISTGTGFVFVVWYELVKWRNRMNNNIGDANHIDL